MHRFILSVAACALLTVAVSAADVWETPKPFIEWSDKELEKVMTDSPWAGKGSLTHARAGAGFGPVPDWKLIVAVRSALPMKQAIVREDVGAGGTIRPEHQQLLGAPEQAYVISISGIPQALGPQLQTTADQAQLRRKDKDPIMAAQASVIMIGKDGKPVAMAPPPAPRPQIVLVQRGGGGRGGGGVGSFGAPPRDDSGVTVTLLLAFPKDDPITADDREFEFASVIGTYNVKRTFKLKDMTFGGELAL